ncbi:MAG: NTP/NDP exchange transporter [Steroidobacteraceae bacterium]
MGHTHRLSRFEHALALLTRVEPGDGRTVAVLFSQALVIMVAYYLVRPVREALILTGGGAEIRSYAVGVQALLLIALIPLYSLAVQRIGARRVVPALCVFLASHLVLFSCAGRAGLHLAFTFFVWVGLFGVVVVAQFWALATDVLDVRAGQRLLGVIAAGVAGGAWIGARLAVAGIETLGPFGLMLASAAVLLVAAALAAWARRSIVGNAPGAPIADDVRQPSCFGGFALILRSRYLFLIAALVVLLNCITSTGEFVLADWLAQRAREQAPGAQSAFIGRFMGNYCASITLLGFALQLLLVSRLIQYAGLARALVATPVAFAAGFLLIGAVPVFAVLQAVLVVHKSLDYSLLNTTRNALLLPASLAAKYEARTAIDTVFYRLGDLLSTLAVFFCVRVLDGSRLQLVWLLVALSATMACIAWTLGREYAQRLAATYHGAPSAETASHDEPCRQTDSAAQPAVSRLVTHGA